ncbi:DoxX protein [Evansella caseinilytica]|uniref:DoxX protein n=1 Tax=Evansella caseinilytica TaxID=1503961 RepID=A0A1H3QBI6_9BACI|nr:DoxX family membrane protein [Evansella caseinilytica]SDZ10491.1 DoxX protein [Evansella caseinilytica]
MKKGHNDQSHRFGPWIAFARIFLGVFWLYEVIIGHNWKVGHPEWVGAGAGEYVINAGTQAIQDGTWAWFGWVWTELVIPYAAFWSYFVIALQLAFGILFIFGLFTRPTAIIAMAFDLSVFFLGNSRIPPLFSIGHIFMLLTNAGMFYGLDALVKQKVKDVATTSKKIIHFLLHLPVVNDNTRPYFIAASVTASIYYFLKIPMMETVRIQMVSLELAALFALGAFLFYMSKQQKDVISLAGSGVRIFIGFKFLHEIFVRDVPALNGMPGWGKPEQLTEVFQIIVDQHWPIISTIVNQAFIPTAAFWAIVFAIVQTLVGIMLVFGWKTQFAAKTGLVFVGLLILLGFTRYTAFIFGYLVTIIGVYGGRFASLDSKKAQTEIRSHFISGKLMAVLLGVSLAAFAATIISGMVPDGYSETMGGFVGSFITIFPALFIVTGYLQRKESVSVQNGSPTKEAA